MAESSSLAELRKKQDHPFSEWLKRVGKKAPFLTDWHSLFWFFVFILILGTLWMGYSLVNNSGTQLYGWDYSSQYTQFAYRFHDMWRYFLKTGEFTLYDTSTFFGTDNIGSNSYYGLFDPFVLLCVVFPRSWVPQMFAFAAILKGACGAMAMRSYLRYMGVSENSSRVGATAFAFCGYLNFFVGFPSVVSMCCTVPLILLGIEKVLKERKPTTLIFSLFLLGVISFFFLVVLCVFGVLYALWRYFWTIKSRNAKQNVGTIALGISCFAVGIVLSAWTLFPSLRESALSGRTTSVGGAYLNSLLSALKGMDLKTFFGLMFQMVGGNSSRELMGLVSFFYPTCNYLWLPLMKATSSSSYDAWTSSLFCYTPMVIFFIFGMVNAVRKKDWQTIIAFCICSYFLFTTFAYYFFYLFTGDGYGRWFIVLVPLIIFVACKGIDEVKESPSWQLPFASLCAVFLTIATFFITKEALKNPQENWLNLQSYWKDSFAVPAEVNGNSLLWLVVYQMCLVVVESFIIYFLHNKKFFHEVLIGLVAVETVVCGNLSFIYGSSWSYKNSYNGGANNASLLQDAMDKTNEQDASFFRTYQDGTSEKNAAMAFGFNGSSNFHSLFNYDVSDLGRLSHIITKSWSYGPTYGETMVVPSWSGYYSNKRADFDLASSYKYYIIRNEGYVSNGHAFWDDEDFAYNVPFGSKVIYQNDRYRVYQSPYSLGLGHAVDNFYQFVRDENDPTHNLNNFYSNSWDSSSEREIIRNEEIYLDGAIFDENIEVPQGFSVAEAPSSFSTNYQKVYGLKAYQYKTKTSYGGFHPSDPGSFLEDSSTWEKNPEALSSSSYSYGQDHDKLVFKKTSGYLNDDPNGAYFLLRYNTSSSGSSARTRIYFIGDQFDENGNLVKENALLSYEYFAISNLITSGNLRYNGLFGFYAPGKVKAIVYCRKVEGNSTATVSMPSVYKMERNVFKNRFEKYASNKEYALDNVSYRTNHFSFESDFSSARICVTSLGYDAGWKIKATTIGESGEKIVTDCPTYKLDGGFVGFLAPEGKVTYSMDYMTPYLKEGVIVSVIGAIAYFGYEITVFALWMKRRKDGSLSLENVSGQESSVTENDSSKEKKEK